MRDIQDRLDELKELVEFLGRNPKVEHFLSSLMVDEEGRARVLHTAEQCDELEPDEVARVRYGPHLCRRQRSKR